MSQVHVFIKPFKDNGEREDDFIEVTDDVIARSIGKIRQQLDHSEYDVGIFRNSNFKIKFANDKGRYNDEDSASSIFRFKRSDSIVRITYEPGEEGLFADGTPSVQTQVFEGLLEDTDEKASVGDQTVRFSVLGYEALFSREIVPFGDIANNDTFEEIIFTILNQAGITDLLTVDVGNINVGTNSITDDVSELENKTVLEALKEILLPASAVLFIDGTTVKVQPRTPGVASVFTFFGQAATGGSENISSIKDFRAGLNRTFNLWTWKGASEVGKDQSSVDRYNTRKKEIDVPLISTGSSAKIQAILNELVSEFGSPREEMLITAPIEIPIFDVFLLNRVTIDYPLVPVTGFGELFALYGIALYGVARYPESLSNFRVDPSRSWKVLSRDLDLENDMATFHLREILG